MTSGRRAGSLLLVLVGAAGLVACAPAGEHRAPGSVECTVLHRPATGSDDGEEEHALTVERGEPPQVLELASMTLEAEYTREQADGSGVRIVVTDPAGEPLVRNLYQVGDGSALSAEFDGGHGFTGLQYTYHEGAELQHYCVAAG